MAHDLGQSKNQVEQETHQSHTHSSQSPAAVAEKKVPFLILCLLINMARIPHGQPNQAFPSSSCSEILVTFPPPPPPPPPPCLFLSLPAATARSLSFQMFRHACRLASIRILRKQTKESERRRERRHLQNRTPATSPVPTLRRERYGFSLHQTSPQPAYVHTYARRWTLTRYVGLHNYTSVGRGSCTLLRKAQRRLLSESEDWWSRDFWR